MMPAIMSEQSAQHERTTNEQPEHLTFVEAGKRLNISPDAVRMRVKRGKLAAVHLNDRTFVLWPQPETIEQPNESRTEHVRSDVQGDSRLVAALEAHIASLEHQLAERSEEIRRRDHIIAGFLERLPEVRELSPGDILDADERSPSTVKTPDASVDAQNAPGRTDPLLRDDLTLREAHSEPVPTEVSLATAWRRWWRRVMGS